MYSGGIGAITADNYENLAAILNTKVGASDGSDKDQEMILPVGEAIVELERANVFKTIPDHQRYYVPRSEYLFKQLQPVLDDLLFLGKGYETMFDRFEMFLALVHADIYTKNGRSIWGPVGRFGWKHSNRRQDSSVFSELRKEAELRQNEWPPLKAGLFDGSYERFKEISEGYENDILNRLNWF